MTNNIIGLTLGPGTEVYVEATGGKLVIVPDGDAAAVLSVNAGEPGPDPLPTGNLLSNGDLQDNDGNVSFEGWFQEPNFYYAPPKEGPHAPFLDAREWLALGYQGWWLQADTDDPARDAWLTVPGSAKAWTETVGELGPHTKLIYKAKELPHMFDGAVFEKIEGWNPFDDVWDPVRTHSGQYGPNTDKKTIPATQIDLVIDLPPGLWYPKYRIVWDVTLATERDAYMIGDVFLGVA